MGADLKLIGKSPNIDHQMEFQLISIMEEAYRNKRDCDYITTSCKNFFGGQWIITHHLGQTENDFEMSFGFTSLKWIKFKRGLSDTYFLFQISEQ